MMDDEAEAKEQLIRELMALRQRVAELEASDTQRLQAEFERDAAREALQESEDQFHTVADLTCDWEFWIGPDGKYRYVSPSCEWITGYSPEEFRKDPGLLEAIAHPDDCALIAEHLQKGLESRAEAYIVFRIITRSGEECWIEHLCQPAFSADGRYLGQRASNRDITERVQAQEALKRLLGELSTLYEAATVISSDFSLDVVLESVAQQMTHALDSSGCTLSLWNHERDAVETLVDYNLATLAETEPRGTVYALNDYPARRAALETCRPILIQREDPTADEAELAWMEKQGACTSLMLPLVVRDRVLGLAELTDELKTRDYTLEQIRLAQSLATQAAIAIENARLFEQAQQEISERVRAEDELRRRNRELALLNRIITVATSTLDAERVLQVACEELAHAFELPRAAAALLNAEATEATVVAEYLAPGRPTNLGNTFPVKGNPAMAFLIEHLTPFAAADAQTHERLVALRDSLRERGTVSLLIVPIILARGRIAGTLELHATERREFSDEELTLAQNVAAAAGQALETARIYQAMRRHSEHLGEIVAQRTIEVHDALLRAQDADRVKSQFVSNVSHELRTPLANLKLYLHLLTRGRPEKRESYMTTLRREVDRLQDLIEALLDISRLDLGKTQANLQPVDMNLLVNTLVTDRWALVADRGLGLDVEEDETLPPALADDKLIEQVLTNVLTNAVNYTPVGGTITLRTRLAETDGQQWVTASVADTGPGISKEEQKHLFERFFRGEAGRASTAPGTGLGLAICREILDLHGGRITVHSEFGQGSTFIIWLAAAD
jgi:PAS domain S-box-containing protein